MSSIRVREGRVERVEATTDAWTECIVRVDGAEARALSYHALTGPVAPGDRVSLNTTASHLGLGTGGYHFVSAVWGRAQDLVGPGHIMKLRYTPSQLRVLSVEEEGSPHREHLEAVPDLAGLPVLVGTVHSQVAVAAAALKAAWPEAEIVYVMTDGGALPAVFSRSAAQLRRTGLLAAVITIGHAFGGDVEAVNIYSGLAAAKAALRADAVIVCMGPGVVGTGTPLGTTSLELAPCLDAAAALGGTPIPIVRASFADPRPRHVGISHHVMTALTRLAHQRFLIPLPDVAPSDWRQRLSDQAEILQRRGHRIGWYDGEEMYRRADRLLAGIGLSVTTMGRSAQEDPVFFWSAAAAADAVNRMRFETSAGD